MNKFRLFPQLHNVATIYRNGLISRCLSAALTPAGQGAVERSRQQMGFTLVELIVTMLISSVFMLTVGQLLITSFQQGLQSSARTDVEYNLRHFCHSLEYNYRHCTNDNVAVGDTGDPINKMFVAFASITPNGGIVQQQYMVDDNKNVYRKYWNSSYVGGVLDPVTPWTSGRPPDGTELLAQNALHLNFQLTNAAPSPGLEAVVWTTTPLPGGGKYDRNIDTTVMAWRQGRL
jgi:prepilin-type N-terminal cleavage/methylation domain-containing protein